MGGKSIYPMPNGKFPDEIVDALKHIKRGIVSMADLQSFKTQDSRNGCVCKHVMQTKETVAELHSRVALGLAVG